MLMRAITGGWSAVTYALPKCQMKGEACISFAPSSSFVFQVACLVLAPMVLVVVVYALRKRTGAGKVIGLGCGFWMLFWIAIGTFGLSGGGLGLVIAMPVVAYGLSAVIVERWTKPHE